MFGFIISLAILWPPPLAAHFHTPPVQEYTIQSNFSFKTEEDCNEKCPSSSTTSMTPPTWLRWPSTSIVMLRGLGPLGTLDRADAPSAGQSRSTAQELQSIQAAPSADAYGALHSPSWSSDRHKLEAEMEAMEQRFVPAGAGASPWTSGSPSYLKSGW